MGIRKRYRKKYDRLVTAVQLDLETDGLIYRKWGGEQRARRGDWLLDNNGDVYTVSRETFADTYEMASPGRYRKTAIVWAEVAEQAGVVKTREGETRYDAGDYLVYNNEEGSDAYAVSATVFEAMYESIQDELS